MADATRAVSTALDDADEMGAPPYVLEVSSPGVDRPLTDPRHFRRNVGRLSQVAPARGRARHRPAAERRRRGRHRAHRRPAKGRPGHEAHIPYADIDRAQVQVEFARGTNEEDS